MNKTNNQRNYELKSPGRCPGVKLVLKGSGVEHAYVWGDFNGWQPASLHMVGNQDSGQWEKGLVLEPGRYEYKFFVHGSLVHEANAHEDMCKIHRSLSSRIKVQLEPA